MPPSRDALGDPLRALPAEAFDRAAAEHLLRRCAFAPAPGEAERFTKIGCEAAVEELVSAQPHTDSELVRALDAALGNADAPERLAAVVLARMASSQTPLVERLALVWHDHFVCAVSKVLHGRWMLDQIESFRRLGRGRFDALALATSRQPAMIRYLDLERSTRLAPNENFARELMELFTLGVGPWTERDVKEAARAFTGHRIARGRFRFSRAAHDAGEKRVLGQRGAFGAAEVVKLCAEHPAAAPFLARMLAKAFLCDSPSESSVAALAQAWREASGEIATWLKRMLRSRLFYAAEHRFARTRSPAEMVLASLRCTGVSTAFEAAGEAVFAMGQRLLDPPSVAGYEGGAAWLTPSAHLARRAFLVGHAERSLLMPGWVQDLGRSPVDEALSQGLRRWTGREPAPQDLAALQDLKAPWAELWPLVVCHPGFHHA